MTHGSLFSGIGGFDLAAEWMGWENVFHCEWNEFGQKVLKYYWPNSESFSDITKTDFTKYANKIDILTGGFPCQPYSQAGKRLGKEDDRHLWPEMLRAIREIKPSWVVGENVYGLVNWNGGLVFHEVQADLEAEGYEVWPFLLPAVSVNAPHRRDRIWFVAYSTSNGKTQNRCSNSNEKGRKAIILSEDKGWESKAIQPIGLCSLQRTNSHSNSNGQHRGNSQYEKQSSQGRVDAFSNISQSNDNGIVANSNSRGLEGTTTFGRDGINAKWESEFGTTTNTKNTRQQTRINGQRKEQSWGRNSRVGISNYWQSFPSVSPICNGDDGLSNRLDSITFPKWRNESIKAGGNAIVPQVVYQIFKAIEQYDTRTQKKD